MCVAVCMWTHTRACEALSLDGTPVRGNVESFQDLNQTGWVLVLILQYFPKQS